MRFVTSPPPEALQGSVRELWQLEDDGGFHAGLPKPWVELVVSLAGVHWWRSAPAGREHRFVEGWVTPIQTGPRHARAVGRRALIGARLEPWAARALFGPLPPGDGAPPPRLRALIGPEARTLRRRLLAARGEAERFATLAEWLLAQPALLRAGVDMRPLPRARDLASAMAVSARSLRRRFAAEIGMPPKRWLELHRLDAVLRALREADDVAPLADIAVRHGFADQAHLSREVGRWTGATPRRLQRRAAGLPPHLLPGG